MCLDVVRRVYKKPSNKVRRGWKVVQPVWDPGRKIIGYTGIYRDVFTTRRFGAWRKASAAETDGRGLLGDGKTAYPVGFHLFLSQQAAEKYRNGHELVVPVEYSEVLAAGSEKVVWLNARSEFVDIPVKVIVARRIRVLRPTRKNMQPKKATAA